MHSCYDAEVKQRVSLTTSSQSKQTGWNLRMEGASKGPRHTRGDVARAGMSTNFGGLQCPSDSLFYSLQNVWRCERLACAYYRVTSDHCSIGTGAPNIDSHPHEHCTTPFGSFLTD